jgi:hypothetical protein
MVNHRFVGLALGPWNAPSRLILPFVLGTIVAACAPAHKLDTVPAEDRMSDSVVSIATGQCTAKANASLTPGDHAALCACILREMQRTMSMQEVHALYEAEQAAGPAEANKTHVVVSNNKMGRVIATCINELGTPSAPSTNSTKRPSPVSEYGHWRASEQLLDHALTMTFCYDPKLDVVSVPSPPLGCVVGDQQITQDAFNNWQRAHKP